MRLRHSGEIAQQMRQEVEGIVNALPFDLALFANGGERLFLHFLDLLDHCRRHRVKMGANTNEQGLRYRQRQGQIQAEGGSLSSV